MKSQHVNTAPVHTTEQGKALTTALSTVVDYLWEDEQKSYAPRQTNGQGTSSTR